MNDFQFSTISYASYAGGSIRYELLETMSLIIIKRGSYNWPRLGCDNT